MWKLRLANYYCLETDQLAYTMEDIGVNNTLNELRTFIDTCQIISRLVQQADNNELPIIDCSNVIQMVKFTIQFNVDIKRMKQKLPSFRRLENIILFKIKIIFWTRPFFFFSISYFRKIQKRTDIESPIFPIILHYFVTLK